MYKCLTKTIIQKRQKACVCTYGCVYEYIVCLSGFQDDTSESTKYSGRPRCLAILGSRNHPQDHTSITCQIIYVRLKLICFEQRESNIESIILLCAVFFLPIFDINQNILLV